MFRFCSLLLVLLEVWHASAANSNVKAVQCNAVGIGNCAACNMPGVDCYQCAAGYVMNYADYFGCTACPANCVQCAWGKSKTIPECTVCQTGYVLGKDGTCTYCGTNCAVCHWTDSKQKATICDACVVRSGISYVTLGALSKLCLTCPANCKTCTEKSQGIATCTACVDRYFLKSSDSTCSACPSYCTTCTDNGAGKGSCSACLAGYVLNNADNTKSCLPCPEGCSSCNGAAATNPTTNQQQSECTSCNDGHYRDGVFCKECTETLEGCSVCTSSSVCTECMKGYALQGSSCTACSYSCNSCDLSNGPEECSECVNFWGLQTDVIGSCTQYPPNCKVCNSVGICTTCDDYYTPNTKGKCVSCSSNCVTCTYDRTSGTTSCTACDTGFRLNSGSCSACILGCASCPDDTTCTTCKDGYYKNVADSTCKDCPTPLPNCITCSDVATCTECAVGYGLNAGGCAACGANCAECALSSASCDTCNSGYVTHSAADCITCNDAHCRVSAVDGLETSCPAGTCGDCADGYFLDTGTCKACIANCQTCSTLTTCDSCYSGYYRNVDNTKCLSCPANCATCTSDTSCTTCVTGYIASGGLCYKCQSATFCNSCFYSSNVKKAACTSCGAGYFRTSADQQCMQCPSYCTTCTGTSSDDVSCTTCLEGYGLDGQTPQRCSVCPYFCKSCSPDDTDPTVLTCDVCINKYILNNNFCGQCPANCLECNNDKGTMMCTVCNTGYAVNTDGTCKACPAQCTQCAISGGKAICSQEKCNPGFGRNGDGTQCVACNSLAFVGCSVCSDASSTGVATCSACARGYILDAWSGACLSTAGLSNCWRPGARPYECGQKSCQSPFNWIKDGPAKGYCGLSCAVCGDIDSDDYRPESECQSSSANYTSEQIPGGCWVSRKMVGGVAMYARGGTMLLNCTATYSNEVVDSQGTSFVCCSSGDNCNSKLILDGISGASAIAFSLALLFAGILATRLH